jgi:hypothetical protein
VKRFDDFLSKEDEQEILEAMQEDEQKQKSQGRQARMFRGMTPTMKLQTVKEMVLVSRLLVYQQSLRK